MRHHVAWLAPWGQLWQNVRPFMKPNHFKFGVIQSELGVRNAGIQIHAGGAFA